MNIIDPTGQVRDIAHINAVERLETLKVTSGSNPWPVISECFNVWKSTNPTQFKSYLIYLDDVKTSRKKTKVGGKTFRGVSKENTQGGYTSYLMDIPEKVLLMIRAIYGVDELPFDKPFYYELGKRFPTLLVRDTV